MSVVDTWAGVEALWKWHSGDSEVSGESRMGAECGSFAACVSPLSPAPKGPSLLRGSFASLGMKGRVGEHSHSFACTLSCLWFVSGVEFVVGRLCWDVLSVSG